MNVKNIKKALFIIIHIYYWSWIESAFILLDIHFFLEIIIFCLLSPLIIIIKLLWGLWNENFINSPVGYPTNYEVMNYKGVISPSTWYILPPHKIYHINCYHVTPTATHMIEHTISHMIHFHLKLHILFIFEGPLKFLSLSLFINLCLHLLQMVCF